MRSSWEKEDNCWSELREEDPEEKVLEPKLEDEMEEDPDEKEFDPELDDDDTEELPEFEKLEAGFGVISMKFSCTFLVSVYPMGPAS